MQFFLLLLFTSLNLFSKEDYLVNKKYRAGSHLIYDCKGKYYVCVDEEFKINCEEERKIAREIKLNQMPCAFLISYKTKKECLLKNYEVVISNAEKKLCYLDGLHHQ